MTIDYQELKKGGFLKQKQKDYFVMRLRTISGNLTMEQLQSISRLAEKYGRGYAHLTTRQGVEIPWVKLSDYNAMRREIKEMKLAPGACGPRIRSVIACPGNEICTHGLVDARKVSGQLDRAFFGREVPVKVKIAVSGCPNSCAKPQENDIGFIGAVEPELNPDLCSGCGLCAEVCSGKAIVMKGELPAYNPLQCIGEANCISSCPTDAWRVKRTGFHLYVGGKIGRFPQLGQKVAEYLPEEQVLPAVEAVLQLHKEFSQPNERLADLLNRLGVDRFREIFADKLSGLQCGEGVAQG